jgi:phosphatidylserine/phosphatidylglycerophosphate/cardiolipin synthase-like enzyme
MIFIEPYAGVSPIISVIDQAKSFINLNVYYIDDNRIINALRQAKDRGIKVRIIIDGKPYGLSREKVKNELIDAQKIGAKIKEAPSRFEKHGRDYVFDHAKYVCSLNRCEIGTANYSYEAFHHNREYLVVTSNKKIVSAANKVFNSDWNGRVAGNYPHQTLVLSPGSESKISSVISQSGPIDIETEEMGNDRAIMRSLTNKGSLVKIILPSSISNNDKKNIEKLIAAGVNVRLMPKSNIYMHAKMIAGGNKGFIGSENFSYSSLSKNREMGLIIHNHVSLKKLRDQFNKDWNIATPVSKSDYYTRNTYNKYRNSRWHKNWHKKWHQYN